MDQTSSRRVSLAFAGAFSLAMLTAASAQAPQPPQAPQADTFAAPVLLRAGDAVLGAGRLYPSPMLHDVNGDGLVDVVVGDLPGRLTVALRVANESTKVPTFAAEAKFHGADGKQLSFGNW
jgi:hypothetical protein